MRNSISIDFSYIIATPFNDIHAWHLHYSDYVALNCEQLKTKPLAS